MSGFSREPTGFEGNSGKFFAGRLSTAPRKGAHREAD
jgi:hypothetical protein